MFVNDLFARLLASFPESRLIGDGPVVQYETGLSGLPVFAAAYRPTGPAGLDGMYIVKIGQQNWAEMEARFHDSPAALALDPHRAPYIMSSPPIERWIAVAYRPAFRTLRDTQSLAHLVEVGGAVAKDARLQIKRLATALVDWNSHDIANGHRRTANSHSLLLDMLTPRRANSLYQRLRTFLPYWHEDVATIAVEGMNRQLPNPLKSLQPDFWSRHGLVQANWPYPIGHTHGDLHTGNILCLPSTPGSPVTIDFSEYSSEGVPFFDLAYLEFDIIQHVLRPINVEYRTQWLSLLEFAMGSLAPDGHPKTGHLAAQAWNLIEPLRRQATRLCQIHPDFAESAEITWWTAAVAAGLNWARKGRDARLPFERESGLLYAAHALEKLIGQVPNAPDAVFVPWIQDGPAVEPERTIHEHEMVPPTPLVFISRADEMHEFRQAISDLAQQDGLGATSTARRVFLFCGEGGWGKTTLLSQCVETCRYHADALFWLYMDWERLAIDARQDSQAMMHQLVSLLEDKYADLDSKGEVHRFKHFRIATYELERTRLKISELRDRRNSQSREDFELILRGELSGQEYAYYERPQRALSQALIQDLVQLAHKRPIVLLLDTWEVVSGQADEWLRKGLLQFTLTNPDVGHRFLFVISGRFPKEARQEYWDAVRRYTHERALYERDLANFTPFDIQQYFQRHPLIQKQISEEGATRIYTATRGIPLAVDMVGSMLGQPDQGIMNSDDVEHWLSDLDAVTGRTIVERLTMRFLRHLETQPEADKQRDYTCICSFAFMRPVDSDEADTRRMKLLRQLWMRLGVIRHLDEYWPLIQRLGHRYSFLFDGARMHTDVYAVLRTRLRGDSFCAGLCEVAAKVCKMQWQRRESELRNEHPEAHRHDPYKDLQWQAWLLDWLHYRLWYDSPDMVLNDLATHYLNAKRRGTENLAIRIMSLVRDDSTIFDHLSPQQRSFVSQLVDLKDWFSDSRMMAERDALLAKLNTPDVVMTLLLSANNASEKGDHAVAQRELESAHGLYQRWAVDGRDMSTEDQIAETYHEIGKRMARLPQRALAHMAGIELMLRASEYAPENPYYRWSLAEQFIHSGRFAEAELEIRRAATLIGQGRFKGVTDRGPELQARIADTRASRRQRPFHYKSFRSAQMITTQRANVLSAQGAFREARRLYEGVLADNPSYVPAIIKLSHLLRQLGQYEEALRRLEPLNLRQISDQRWKAAALDARGALLLATNQLDDALRFFEDARRTSTDYLNPWYGLGRLHLHAKRPVEAVNAFEAALRIKERSAWSTRPIKASLFWIHNGLGCAHLLARHRDIASYHFAVSDRLTEIHLKRVSRQYQTWSQRGVALLGQSDIDDQLEKVQDTFERFAQFEQIHLAKGYLEELRGDLIRIGRYTHTSGWQRIAGLITALIEVRPD